MRRYGSNPIGSATEKHLSLGASLFSQTFPMRVGCVLTLLLCASVSQAADYSWPVVRVVDGDTVKVDASADIPLELASIAVRLRGVDTPEKGWRAKCETEKRAGTVATNFTKDAINKSRAIIIRNPTWGKYGGRVIADIILDERSLSALLIQTGHGRAYLGGKRESWCE